MSRLLHGELSACPLLSSRFDEGSANGQASVFVLLLDW